MSIVMPGEAPTEPIPKTLWLLWLQGWEHAPEIVQRCAALWRELNPEWTLVPLSRSNLDQYVGRSCLDALEGHSANHQADLIRMNILRDHGGLWADATVACRQPLDGWVMPYLESGFFAFADPGPDRRCASWFLFSEPGGPIATALAASLHEFLSTSNFDRPGRLSRALVHRLEPQVNAKASRTAFWFTRTSRRHLRHKPYFTLHYLFNSLIETDESCAAQWARTPNYDAHDSHLVARLGFASPVTRESQRMIDESSAPVFKLSWKRDPQPQSADTNMGYALRSLERGLHV
jgi:hypothetical protein